MTESTVTTDVRGLLAAVVTALDVPPALWSPAAEQARERLLTWRTIGVRLALEGILAGDYTVADATAILADHTAESPATYAAWVPAHHCPHADFTLRWELLRGNVRGWELRRRGELLGTLDGFPAGAKPNSKREALAWAVATSEIPADRWIQKPARSGAFHVHADADATCPGGAR